MATSAVIHLIDDDDAVRQSLAFTLTTAGLAVRAYASASLFLDALPGLQPGCVVSDFRMPGIDGLALQRRLNGLQINLPMIIMTGHGDVRLAVEAMKAGAVDFIEKPFDDEVLLAAIGVALAAMKRMGIARRIPCRPERSSRCYRTGSTRACWPGRQIRRLPTT